MKKIYQTPTLRTYKLIMEDMLSVVSAASMDGTGWDGKGAHFDDIF